MDHDFILFGDIDQERNVKAKKAVLKSRFCVLSNDRIVVIIQEIESWYLAGLDDKAQKHLSLRSYRNTNHITKEIFNRMIPRSYTSRIAFMADILDLFSIDMALEKNRSFRYFFTRFLAPACPCSGATETGSGIPVGAGRDQSESPDKSVGGQPGEPGPDEVSGKI